MFHTILVPIDLGSEASWRRALPQAVELARLSGGTLHLMSVVPDVGMPLVEGYFPKDFERQALQAAKTRLDELARREVSDEVRHEQHIRLGHIWRNIRGEIDAVGADLVVMASHDPDTTRDFLIGSNADRVVRRAPCSVLVVRE
ncbi:universal stress protein [Roseivivax sp. CAU 1761]